MNSWGGGSSGEEFVGGGAESSKRQVRGNFHTDKHENASDGELNPPPPTRHSVMRAR